MMSKKSAIVACLAPLAMLAAQNATAQAGAYPSQSVKLVVGWTAGGSTDTLARNLAAQMAKQLGQAVVVDNRPGAVGTIAHAEVARAKPDGYTLILATNSTYAIAPHLIKPLAYANDALAPIALLGTSPMVMVSKAGLNVDGIKGLLELARKQPGRLNIASGGNGSTSHLAGELLKEMTHTSFTHIPYKAGHPATMAIAAGEVDVGFADIGVATPLMKSGRLIPLAVSGNARSPLLPNLPTIAESGVPNFESSTKFALFAPAGTPTAIIDRLQESVRIAMTNEELREKLRQQSVEVLASSPAELRKDVSEDLAKWGRLIKERKLALD